MYQMAKRFKLDGRKPKYYLNVKTGCMTKSKKEANQWYDEGTIIGLMYSFGFGYQAASYVQPGTNRFCLGCNEETGQLYDFVPEHGWVEVV